MAIVGVKLVTLALIDDDQKLIADAEKGLSKSGIYTVDHKDLGTKSANITGLIGTLTKVFGNNVAQDVTVGAGAPAVALDMNNLNFLIHQKLKGFVSDGKGGFTDQHIKQHVAMLINSQTIDRKNNVYYAFGNGLWTEAEKNIQTDDADEHRVDDNPTFTALDTMAFGNQPYKIYTDLDPDFDEAHMMAETFGGYVAPTTNPTPDASATGQA